MAIVNILHRNQEGGGIDITANLLGPIIVNIPKRLARQVVLENYPYSHRQPIPQIKK